MKYGDQVVIYLDDQTDLIITNKSKVNRKTICKIGTYIGNRKSDNVAIIKTEYGTKVKLDPAKYDLRVGGDDREFTSALLLGLSQYHRLGNSNDLRLSLHSLHSRFLKIENTTDPDHQTIRGILNDAIELIAPKSSFINENICEKVWSAVLHLEDLIKEAETLRKFGVKIGDRISIVPGIIGHWWDGKSAKVIGTDVSRSNPAIQGLIIAFDDPKVVGFPVAKNFPDLPNLSYGFDRKAPNCIFVSDPAAIKILAPEPLTTNSKEEQSSMFPVQSETKELLMQALEESKRKAEEISKKETASKVGIKAELGHAGYRIASTQILNLSKNLIINSMRSAGGDNEHIQSVASLLDTDLGHALISMMLGMGLTYAPQVKDNPKAMRLASEFRIGSMALAGNSLFETLLGGITPAIIGALNTLNQEEIQYARVEEEAQSTTEKELDPLEIAEENLVEQAGTLEGYLS
jgi:hypothetical protein